MSETGPAYSPQYTPPSGPSGPRANFGYRLLAWIVDSIITGVAFSIVFFGLAAIDEALGVLGYILGFVGLIAYFTYFEGGPSGQTPGKKIVNIRVIDFNSGGPIGYGRALGRYFARILSGLPCYLGYFWMLWDREKQTWHDKLVTCVVVPTDAYPVEPT
jgi:uncharacterized RDD family membrane protein YckC